MHTRATLFLLVFCGFFTGALSPRPAFVQAQTKAELQAQSEAAYNRAIQLWRTGNYQEAEKLMLYSLEIEKVVGSDGSYTQVIGMLGVIYQDTGRVEQAEAYLLQALQMREGAFGRNHVRVGDSLITLGEFYRKLRRFSQADEMTLRAVAIFSKASSKSDPWLGTAINNLAASYSGQGRYAEAAQAVQRAIVILEKADQKWEDHYASALTNAGNVFSRQGRFDEAEALYKRAGVIREKMGNAAGVNAASHLHNLGRNYVYQGRYPEAEAIFKRALDIDRRLFGNDHPNVAERLGSLGMAYSAQARYAEAEQAVRQSIEMYRRLNDEGAALGKESDLAKVYVAQGQYAKAQPIIVKSLPRLQKTYGSDHPAAGELLYQLGLSERGRKRWTEAAANFRQAAEIWKKNAMVSSSSPSLVSISEYGRTARATMEDMVQALWQVSEMRRSDRETLANEAFAAAQYAAPTSSGAALAQMTARLAAGDTEIGKLAREAQDLGQQRPAVDTLLAQARGASGNWRSDTAIAELQDRLQRIDKRLIEIDATIANRFPEYAALSKPQPLALTDVQALVAPSEAFIAYFATERDSFVWAVSRAGWEWKHIDVTPDVLAKQVTALRCGLDQNAWREEGSAARCLEVLALPRDKMPNEGDAFRFGQGARTLYPLIGSGGRRHQG